MLCICMHPMQKCKIIRAIVADSLFGPPAFRQSMEIGHDQSSLTLRSDISFGSRAFKAQSQNVPSLYRLSFQLVKVRSSRGTAVRLMEAMRASRPQTPHFQAA